jgi:glycosyltransferase involved in cell wall biosynthesis
MSQRQALSVTIITRDAAHQLAACLASVAFADEILVVDSGSSDGTPDLAAKQGARVLHQDWLGYGRQKQFAVEQARHDWVLCIDADERVSPELRASMEAALQAPSAAGYAMPRCNLFLGRWLRHGEGYPDWSLRLFDRRRGRWSEDPVHEKVVCEGAVGKLSGDLLHESCDSLAVYLDKQNRYTTLQAEALHRAGRRAHAGQLLLSPLLRFVKFYLLRLGFLDGVPGLAHIAIGCNNSFVKYAKLIELNKKEVK